MAEPASALGGAIARGYVTVREDDPRDMVQVKADLSADVVRSALREAAGLDMPDRLRISVGDRGAAAWMAPDEVLLLLPTGSARRAVETFAEAMGRAHHLVLDLSDLRAGIRLEGDLVREVLAKVTPADMAPDRFEPGHFRRTRLAQVPAAIWLSDEAIAHILCFRSVARYVFNVMTMVAQVGGEVDVF